MNHVKEIVNAKNVYLNGIYGKNIRIAILDTGVFRHEELENRIIQFVDFVNDKVSCYDDNGHGTHIAGIVAGKGKRPKYLFSGMAPKAELVVLKVLDYQGNGYTPNVIKALEWIKNNHIKYKIKLLNISFGFLSHSRISEQKELLDIVDELWDMGITVVAAAGNDGPKAPSIVVPGVSRKVITVGSLDERNYRNKIMPSYYSGCGPTRCCITKPEILAPGTNIISLDNKEHGYSKKSGTSMATPVVCGSLALVYERYPDIFPEQLKLYLYEMTKESPINKKRIKKGTWGLLDVDCLIHII